MARKLIVEIVGDPSGLQKALGAAAASADTFGAKMSAAGSRISGVGRSLTRNMTLPIVGIGAVSVKAAVDFQNSMELLHTQAGVSQAAVDRLSKSVLALAGPTATAPDELAKGIYHIASQGVPAVHQMEALRIAAEGAKMGQADLEDVTNALGAAISSGIKGTQNYGQAMGQMNAIVGAGDMRMQDLADAMGHGMAVSAKLAGVSLDQVGAALAVFGDANIRGAAAGTMLRSSIRLLSAPSSASAKTLAGMGVSVDTLRNKLSSGGLTSAIGYLRDRMTAAGITGNEVGAKLSQAFGGKQADGIKIMYSEFDRLKTKLTEVDKGGSSFASNWEAYTKTTSYHLASMGAQMQASGVTIGDVLLPVVSKIADFIGKLAAKFEGLSAGARKFILIAAGIAAVIGPIVGVVGAVVTAIGGLSTALMFLAANPIVLLIGGLALFVGAVAAAVLWPDKLRSVLEKMGLSAHAAGEIVDGLRSVFEAVKVAGETLVAAVRDHWSQISAVISTAVGVVQNIIGGAVSIVTGLWHTFGATLTSAAETYWGYIKDTIRNALEVIRGVIEVVTGLIHGDWSQVWQGIKDILSGAVGQMVNVLRTAAALLGDAAQLIGTAIWKGIVEPLIKLGEELLHKVETAISSAIHDVAGWVVGLAEQIGSSIVHGVVNGISGLGSAIKSKAEGMLKSALSSLNPFSPVEHGGEIYIGNPIVAGAIKGLAGLEAGVKGKVSGDLNKAIVSIGPLVATAASRLGTKAVAAILASTGGLQQSLAQQLSTALTAAMQQAAQAVVQAKGTFVSAFQTVASSALSGFDAVTSKWTPSATKVLDKMQLQDQVNQYKGAVTTAAAQVSADMKALAAAQAGGDPAAVAAAQQQLISDVQAYNAAQRSLQEFNLQQLAAKQQAAHDKQRAAEREHLAKQLLDLQSNLEKHPAAYEKTQREIMDLLKKYDVPMFQQGQRFASQLADGLKSQIKAVEAAAESLAQAVAKYIVTHSPAKAGPLSEASPFDLGMRVGRGFSQGITAGLSGGFATLALASGLAVPARASGGQVAAAAGGGGAMTVNIYVPSSFVGSEKQLVDGITAAFVRAGNSGHPYWKNVNRLT